MADPIYGLIHSPLVGPLTWSLVARHMRQTGVEVVVPVLSDSPSSAAPFWKQHAGSVARAFTRFPPDVPLTWVAHSGAGPLLPAIRQSVANPARAYVFVDAGIPRDRASRLDLMNEEDPGWATEFEQHLTRGGVFPDWQFDDLQEVLPDESLRRQMIGELQPRDLAFFREPIPVFTGWPDAPCIYIQCSAPYQQRAAQARQAGWPTYELGAGHFHMLVDPSAVTDLLLQAVARSS